MHYLGEVRVNKAGDAVVLYVRLCSKLEGFLLFSARCWFP